MPAVLHACSHSLHALRHFQVLRAGSVRLTTDWLRDYREDPQAIKFSHDLGTIEDGFRVERGKATDIGSVQEPWATVVQILKCERATSAREGCLLVVLHAEAFEEAFHSLSSLVQTIRQLPGDGRTTGGIPAEVWIRSIHALFHSHVAPVFRPSCLCHVLFS
jgi:hypothetical protein